MDLQQVLVDIENRSNRTLAAIERWTAAAPGRQLTIAFAPIVDGVGGWQVRLSQGWLAVGSWTKPTLMDALGHAASYCAVEAGQPALLGAGE